MGNKNGGERSDEVAAKIEEVKAKLHSQVAADGTPATSLQGCVEALQSSLENKDGGQQNCGEEDKPEAVPDAEDPVSGEDRAELDPGDLRPPSPCLVHGTDFIVDSQLSDDTEDMGSKCSCLGKTKAEAVQTFPFEEDLIENTIMPSGKVKKAAIVGFEDSVLRASGPKSFVPKKAALDHIIKALQGDTEGIAADGIDLGSGTNVSTPGKLDAGKAIYGSDGKGGGCTVFKTKECVLIVVYESDSAPAIRLAQEVSEHMEENGH